MSAVVSVDARETSATILEYRPIESLWRAALGRLRRNRLAFVSGLFIPWGNPITVHTSTPLPSSRSAHSGTHHGCTHTLANRYWRASAQIRSISERGASGFRIVWSM